MITNYPYNVQNRQQICYQAGNVRFLTLIHLSPAQGISTGMSEEETEKPQILIVDDSRVIRSAAFTMLSDDYLVHETVDGMDSWEQLRLLL